MTTKAQSIARFIESCASLFGFSYHGAYGNVDPCYHPDTGEVDYLLYFDGEEQTVHTVEDAMNTPFIAGRTLADVAVEIEITEM